MNKILFAADEYIFVKDIRELISLFEIFKFYVNAGVYVQLKRVASALKKSDTNLPEILHRSKYQLPKWQLRVYISLSKTIFEYRVWFEYIIMKCLIFKILLALFKLKLCFVYKHWIFISSSYAACMRDCISMYRLLLILCLDLLN